MLCAVSALMANAGTTIFGDIGSNNAITLATGATVHGDAGIPAQYTGVAKANGTITCATSCAAQEGRERRPARPGGCLVRVGAG